MNKISSPVVTDTLVAIGIIAAFYSSLALIALVAF